MLAETHRVFPLHIQKQVLALQESVVFGVQQLVAPREHKLHQSLDGVENGHCVCYGLTKKLSVAPSNIVLTLPYNVMCKYL